MKILLLGSDVLKTFLESHGDEVTVYEDYLDLYHATQFDYIISHGYRHILSKAIVDRFKNRAINLHISYLPWNRGADPNYWSWKDKTPKGVTIHHIDEGVDTGMILFQKEVEMDDDMTLKTSYEKLQNEIVSLFKEKWMSIRGTYHYIGDMPKLKNGWDTKVCDV